MAVVNGSFDGIWGMEWTTNYFILICTISIYKHDAVNDDKNIISFRPSSLFWLLLLITLVSSTLLPFVLRFSFPLFHFSRFIFLLLILHFRFFTFKHFISDHHAPWYQARLRQCTNRTFWGHLRLGLNHQLFAYFWFLTKLGWIKMYIWLSGERSHWILNTTWTSLFSFGVCAPRTLSAITIRALVVTFLYL